MKACRCARKHSGVCRGRSGPHGQHKKRSIAAATTGLSALFLTWAIGAVAAATEPAPGGSRDLADLSIEELMNESITSVSKKEQRIR